MDVRSLFGLVVMAVLGSSVAGYSAPKAFVITTTDDGFSISVKKVQLLKHTETRPIIYVGKGQTQFHEDNGNWLLDEQLEEKVGLTQFEFNELPEVTRLKLSSASGIKVELELGSSDFNPLSITWVSVPDGYDRFWIQLYAEPDERVYGGGEQFTHFNLRGRNFPIWIKHRDGGQQQTSDGAADGDNVYHMSHFPLPTFVSTRRYYCHVAGYNYVDLSFRHDNYHEISIMGMPDPLYLNVKSNMEALVRGLTYFLWRQPALPAWVHDGLIIGTTGGTSQMVAQYKVAKDAGVQVSGMFIPDWSGSVSSPAGTHALRDWTWDTGYYPGLDKEIERLKKEDGVRVLAYISPHLHPHGSVYQIAETSGYLIRNNTGHPYHQQLEGTTCGTVDLTNPDAFKWLKGVITKNLIDFGLGGWMADFSEYTPVDGVFHNGMDGRLVHNLFPVLWARLNREAVAEAEKISDVVFFMRAGGTGSQRYALLTWAGNQKMDWSYSNGLPSTVTAALSFGMSGIGQTHLEIERPQGPLAGTDTKKVPSNKHSEELFLRSAELAAFTAVMRIHEGNQSTMDWQLQDNPSSLQRFATLTRIYKSLAPYRKRVEREHVRGGIPMQRPLFLHYEDDEATYDIQYQYMFGRDLLVAPVVEKGVTSWKVYLPKDGWEHLFDEQEVDGPGWITVQAPIGRPPVFFRKNSKWRKLFIRARNIAKHGVNYIPTSEDLQWEQCDVEHDGCQ